MTSPLLALFVRSVREDARARVTYWVRGGFIMFLLLIMMQSTVLAGGAPGLAFFSRVIWLQFVAITLVGLSWFTSAIIEESEEDMLGLLAMTNLNPLSILLGKSTSRLCGALLVLAGGLPFALLSVTLGGVSLGQILAAYCTLGAYIFLLCNLCLRCAILSSGMAWAVVKSVLVLAAFFLAGLMSMAVGASGWGWLVRVSPILRLREILQTGFVEGPVGWQVCSTIALGVVCFAFAWMGFARFVETVLEGRAREELKVPIHYEEPAPMRPPRAWADAIAWKEFYFIHGGRPGFYLRILGYAGVWLLVWAVAMATGDSLYLQVLAYPIVRGVVIIDAALAASWIFRKELQEKTWSGLALLPATLPGVVASKVRGTLHQMSPALVSFAAISILWFVRRDDWTFGWVMRVVLGIPAGLLHIACAACFVAYLSLWMRRGAFALGLLLVYFGTRFLSLVMFGGTFTSFVQMPVYFAGILLLRKAILRRLEALAGAD